MVLQDGPGTQQNQVISSRMNNWYGQVMFVAVGRGRGVHAAIMPHSPKVVETPGLS
jgi:hypothetical protein